MDNDSRAATLSTTEYRPCVALLDGGKEDIDGPRWNHRRFITGMPSVQYFIIQLLFLRITKPTVNELLSIEYLTPGLKRERMRQGIRTFREKSAKIEAFRIRASKSKLNLPWNGDEFLMQVFPVHRKEILAVKHYLPLGTPPIVTVCNVLCNIFS
jgi:hypothetical protein